MERGTVVGVGSVCSVGLGVAVGSAATTVGVGSGSLVAVGITPGEGSVVGVGTDSLVAVGDGTGVTRVSPSRAGAPM